MSTAGFGEMGIVRGESFNDRGEIKIQSEVVTDMIGGEGGVVPVHGAIQNLEMDRLGLDPAGKATGRNFVPAETLPAEQNSG